MTEREWLDLGRKRIKNNLKNYIACTPLQLEMKISEAGPTYQRVEPVLLKDARNELLRAGEIDQISYAVPGKNPMNFFTLANADMRSVNPRMQKLSRIHSLYEDISSQQGLCGFVLEYIVQKAIKESGQFNYISTIYRDTPTHIEIAKNVLVNTHNGETLPENYSLDVIAFHKGTGIPIGVEVKNKRAWKYGDDCEIWQCIDKCATLGIMPVFVHRKIPALTRFSFSKIGMLGMESQFQYFHPSQEPLMGEILDKALLGFSDIKFSVDPPPYMVEYFRKTVPDQIEKYYKTFMDNRELLKEYCSDRCLADDGFRGPYRYRAYLDFKKEISE